MMFLGDFLCGNVMSVPCTPTDINNITNIELSNGWYDDLRITHNVEEELSSEVNQDWDWDTILHAKFDDSVGAGNVLWNFDTVSHLLIKRKKVDDFKWITLETHKIETIEDFNIRNIDKTAKPNYQYQYAAVPIKNGVEDFSGCKNVNSTNYLVDWSQSEGTWNHASSDYSPKKGDMIFFDWDGSRTSPDHVGLVVKYDSDSGTITTVEGNSSNSVRVKTYNRNDACVLGYTSIGD